MEQEDYTFRFLWGPREESLAECAARARRFFLAIRKVSPLFQEWWDVGSSGSEAQLKRSARWLEAHLARGANRSEMTNEPIPDLGFMMTLTNDLVDGVCVNIDLHCGIFNEWLCNRVSFRMGFKANPHLFYDVSMLERLFEVAVVAWQPDHGVITSEEYTELVPLPGYVPRAGWITYVSSDLAELPRLPRSARVTEIKGHGHVIVAMEEKFTARRKRHVARVKKIEAALGFVASSEALWEKKRNRNYVEKPKTTTQAVKKTKKQETREKKLASQAKKKADRALKRIERLGGTYLWEPELFVVDLSGTAIENDDLAVFADLPLVTILDLSDTAVGDAGLKHLHPLARLETLAVADTKVTVKGAKRLRSALPGVVVHRDAGPKGYLNPFVA